nr:reverse transcriptase domain-containing protein [Tanacetum cinerariifolium]
MPDTYLEEAGMSKDMSDLESLVPCCEERGSTNLTTASLTLDDNHHSRVVRLPSPKDICRWRKFFGGHVRALLQKLRNQHKGVAKGVKDTVSGILKENENEKPGSCGIHNSLNDKILNCQRDGNHGFVLGEVIEEKHPEKAEPSPPPRRNVAMKEGNEGKDESAKTPRENKPQEKVLRKHADAFAWVPADMTGIPGFIAEHQLKTYPHGEPRVQKKRSPRIEERWSNKK